MKTIKELESDLEAIERYRQKLNWLFGSGIALLVLTIAGCALNDTPLMVMGCGGFLLSFTQMCFLAARGTGVKF